MAGADGGIAVSVIALENSSTVSLETPDALEWHVLFSETGKGNQEASTEMDVQGPHGGPSHSDHSTVLGDTPCLATK